MLLIGDQYRYLLIVGFCFFSLSHWCFKIAVNFLLGFSSAGLCQKHTQGTKGHARPQQEDGPIEQTTSDRLRVRECEDCRYSQWQMSIEISERCVGFLHYSNCTVFSFWIIQETKHDVMNAKSSILVPFVQFSVTYFAYDILAMYASFSTRKWVKDFPLWTKIQEYVKKRTALIIHHILIIVIGYPIAVNYSLRNNFGDFFLGCLCIGDASSHFVSTTYILRILNLQDSIYFSINGFFLFVSFVIFRILILPFMYLQYFHQEEVPWREALLRIPAKCHLGMMLVVSFQTYWFFTIVKGAYKLFFLEKQTLKQS